jgi:hypothetical protein
MELNWFIVYLFLWFYLRINSLWTALTALRSIFYKLSEKSNLEMTFRGKHDLLVIQKTNIYR